MFDHKSKNIVYFLQNLALRVFITILRVFPFTTRVRIGGTIISFFTSSIKTTQNRISENLHRIFPDISKADEAALIKAVGKNAGASVVELLNNPDFIKQKHLFHPSGEGIAALQAAQKEGKGAILVSGHFGSWEAGRHYLRTLGIEVGVIYRTNNNPYYDKLHLKMMKIGGEPIFQTGRRGTMNMVKHLRSGGVIAIMHDQMQKRGKDLDFMGENAKTSVAAAELALKYGVPLIPIYGVRRDNSPDIDVVLEAPIPHTDANTMMQAANDSLAAMVKKHPEQWYWLHQRWKKNQLG